MTIRYPRQATPERTHHSPARTLADAYVLYPAAVLQARFDGIDPDANRIALEEDLLNHERTVRAVNEQQAEQRAVERRFDPARISPHALGAQIATDLAILVQDDPDPGAILRAIRQLDRDKLEDALFHALAAFPLTATARKSRLQTQDTAV